MRKFGVKNITIEQRLLIKQLKEENKSAKEIAMVIGVCERSIYRELSRGLINGKYDPYYAQNKSDEKNKNKGVPSFFEVNKDAAELISKLILNDKLSVIDVINKLKEEQLSFPSRQTLYVAINKGLIPNVTMENLSKNTTSVFSNGLINIPIRIRQQLNINDGDILEFRVENNQLIFEKVNW